MSTLPSHEDSVFLHNEAPVPSEDSPLLAAVHIIGQVPVSTSILDDGSPHIDASATPSDIGLSNSHTLTRVKLSTSTLAITAMEPIAYINGQVPNSRSKAGDYEPSIEKLVNAAGTRYKLNILTIRAFPSKKMQADWARGAWVATCLGANRQFAALGLNRLLKVACGIMPLLASLSHRFFSPD